MEWILSIYLFVRFFSRWPSAASIGICAHDTGSEMENVGKEEESSDERDQERIRFRYFTTEIASNGLKFHQHGWGETISS